jgi:ribose transport system permease protein
MAVREEVGDLDVAAHATIRWRRLAVLAARDYGIVISFLALFIALTIWSDAFLTKRNLLNVVDQSAAVGIVAIAGTLVIIAGGFDLSVGSIFSFAGVVAATVALEIGAPLGLAIGVLAGLVMGALNGALVTAGRINPFVATLASSIMIRGFALVVSGGLLIPVYEANFTGLGRGSFLGVRYPSWVFFGFAVMMTVILTRTLFGRYVFACGANPEAARRAGIHVGLVRAATFAVSGLAAGLAGILVASRVATGQPDTGVDLPLTAIAAIVVGGTSILGGEGAIWRTVVGVLLLTLIGNGFNLVGVDPTYQRMLEGGIILGAVGVDAWFRKQE